VTREATQSSAAEATAPAAVVAPVVAPEATNQTRDPPSDGADEARCLGYRVGLVFFTVLEVSAGRLFVLFRSGFKLRVLSSGHT